MTMQVLKRVSRTLKTKLWWSVIILVIVTFMEVNSLSGPNICMVKQKYNITKRVKYRAPMSVRTYEWCFAVPPRCSKWTTEMRDVTRLETEERTAEMAVCCPGYKLKDVTCVSICPNGKTGPGCSEDCRPNKWGPNCVHDCKKCANGICDPVNGDCRCQDGWQGESCEISISTTAAIAMMEQLLTSAKPILSSTKSTEPTTPPITTTTTGVESTSSIMSITSSTFTPVVTTPLSTTNTEGVLETTLNNSSKTRHNVAASKATEILFTMIPETTKKTSNAAYNITLSSNPTTPNTFSTERDEYYKWKTVPTTDSKHDKTESHKSVEISSAVNMKAATDNTTRKYSSTPTTNKPKSMETISTHTTSAMTTYRETIRTTAKDSSLTAVTHEIKRQETTVKQSTTTKFQPKEIWIRPAQKGDSSIIETKIKLSHDIPLTRYRNKDVSKTTTPKTIIVSIIPTSVTYVNFKKLALSTASSLSHKMSATAKKSNNNSAGQPFTKSITLETTAPSIVRTISRKATASPSSTINLLSNQHVTKSFSTTRPSKDTTDKTQTTNSMMSTLNVANKQLTPSSLTTTTFSFPTNGTAKRTFNHAPKISANKQTAAFSEKSTKITDEALTTKKFTEHVHIQKEQTTENSLTSATSRVTKMSIKSIDSTKFNATSKLTKSNATTLTVYPLKDEETFHVLTEPEHITAVMGDKETDRSTIDLISVISIAGGVMMAIITVAVVIVMLDRCKKPRYDDVRKFNDIKMQVMIDNNDIPPPYVRSIFHTPLPDPPTSEKCHYQPISTLDRNLKQFMRPVVVQTISPLMLENFRGILECHYDHLPRRSQDMGTMEARCSMSPSVDEHTELLPHRGHSLTDSDIEALKCEAKMDVIDNTTSEPLYAEIPCWRPPSAHAIEVVNVNLNGEAVTEL